MLPATYVDPAVAVIVNGVRKFMLELASDIVSSIF